MITRAIKQPAEATTLGLPFPAGRVLTGLLSIAAEPRGLVAGADPLGVVGGFGGGLVTATVSGGTDGERYLITARASAMGGEELEAELEIAVIDGAWTMPDGGAPWLSIAEFVQRFGLDEVIAMTDRAGVGRIDREYLIQALADGQAIAEANVASRYALPLPSVPAILKLYVADLARARLYPRGAPEGVGDAAKAATRSLERIQSGAQTLPLAEPASAAPSDAPVLGFAGSRPHPDGLGEWLQ